MVAMVEPTAPLTELVATLDRRDVSARELLERYLDRIERLDSQISVRPGDGRRGWRLRTTARGERMTLAVVTPR